MTTRQKSLWIGFVLGLVTASGVWFQFRTPKDNPVPTMTTTNITKTIYYLDRPRIVDTLYFDLLESAVLRTQRLPWNQELVGFTERHGDEIRALFDTGNYGVIYSSVASEMVREISK